MSELTKEQLLDYVKKQKIKIKKLEAELSASKKKAEDAADASTTSSTPTSSAEPGISFHPFFYIMSLI